MSARGIFAVFLVLAGIFVMTVSYFWLGAPWGFPPDSEVYSNPRVEFAPAIFILGVLLAFLAAVVYELLPEEKRGPRA